MIFDVMSEREALAFSADPDILSCVMISIRDPDDEDLLFAANPAIKAILHLKFFDSEENRIGAVSGADAARIAAFVKTWAPLVESVVVHCQEGVSRSAGVCAALMRHLNGDDEEIWGDVRYNPNMRCYRLVLEAMEKA